jgi:hypothetical protein
MTDTFDPDAGEAPADAVARLRAEAAAHEAIAAEARRQAADLRRQCAELLRQEDNLIGHAERVERLSLLDIRDARAMEAFYRE